MADYYPLISRAVAGLEKNTGENRRALYERARGALLTQLRSLTPALNESDITRERLALEESIRKVEAESARKFVETVRQPAPPRARAVEPRRPEQERPAPSHRYVNPPSPSVESGLDVLRRPRPPFPLSEKLPSAVPIRTAVKPETPVALREETAPREPYAPPPIPELARAQRSRERFKDDSGFDRAQPEMFEPPARHEPVPEPRRESYTHNDFSEPMLESSFAVDDHPVAGSARHNSVLAAEDADFERPEGRARTWLAWRPSRELARGIFTFTAVVGALVVVAGLLAWQGSNMLAMFRSMRAPEVETARNPPSSVARPKIADRIEPGTQSNAVAAPPVQAVAAVAQKVVLYEEDPADPNGKRFVGSAIWRTETVNPGPGQPPELAVRADVEVPERKLAMTWSLRRNTDKSLPASHTVEIIFKLPADFVAGGISNVPGILMKSQEQTRGVPLSGLAVKVTNGFFLIGLSSVDADKERNLQLLKDRGWFDIPVVYNNNRRAILALEKGTPGDRVFAEAFKVWKQ
jgi:hypothetical protein